MAFGKIESQLSDINVTPLVDVMLVLLIIFMVTAPLMHREVNVELPKANANVMKYDENQLTVSITKDGIIQLQSQPINLSELGTKLAAVQRENKDAEVYLSADRRVNYGVVVEVIAAIKQAGITKLGMVTDPQNEKASKP